MRRRRKLFRTQFFWGYNRLDVMEYIRILEQEVEKQRKIASAREPISPGNSERTESLFELQEYIKILEKKLRIQKQEKLMADPMTIEDYYAYDKPSRAVKKETGTTGFARETAGRTELEKQRIDEPGTERPELEKQRIDEPGTERPELEKQRIDEPGTEKPELEKQRIDESEIEKPEIDSAGIDNNTYGGDKLDEEDKIVKRQDGNQPDVFVLEED